MTTETVANTTTQKSPSAELAIKLQTGIAAAQTAYSLNNGGGLTPGEPLRMIEDAALINAAGARPLNVTIPDGYVIRGVYRDEKTGLDAYFAVNVETKQFLVGFAGTNGFGRDYPDTYQDIARLGVGHAQELIENKKFRDDFENAVEQVGGVNNINDFLIAGQSLAAAVARIFGAMAVFGAPLSQDNSAVNTLGLHPDQISVVGINGLGTEYGLKQAGFSNEQIGEYNEKADLNLIVAINSVTGTIDLISQTGGSQGGSIWGLEVREETSLGGLHRLNYGVAEGLALIDGDLTKLTALELTPISHQTISNNLNNIQNTIPLANNGFSLSLAGYVAVLFSKPGESAAGISQGLQSYLGISKPLSDVLGGAGELFMRGLPIARVAQVMQLLVGGYAVGQAIGSQPTAEVSFPELQAGWTRTNLTVKDSEAYLQGWRFSLDTNTITGVQVVRSGSGFTQEVHPDGTIIYTHPQFGIGVFNADGSGTLHLKEIDSQTGETLSARVSFETNTHIEMTADGWRAVKPLDANGERAQTTYYTGTKSTIYEGSYNSVDKESKTTRIFSIDNVRHETLATDFSLSDPNFTWTITRSILNNGHSLTVTRDDDRRVVEVVEEKIIGAGKRLITTSDGSGNVQSARQEEQLNANTARTITSDENGNPLETCVKQIYHSGNEIFVLSDVTDHKDNSRLMTVSDANGYIVKAEAIPVDSVPIQMTDQSRDQMHADVVDFITALRQKDKAGVIISSARLVLDYARTQGAVSPAYVNMVGDASNTLNLVGSLRALGSGDTLAQLGGAVGLFNSTNYFSGRLAGTGTGYLSSAQTAALSTAGAVLSIANLANLGQMIDNKQFGSATASVVSAVNAIGYLGSASTSLMGANALIAINPIVMIVVAILIDQMFAEDPPPPPPQGFASFLREADGSLGFRLSETNDLGESILTSQMEQLLPKLEEQLATANQGNNNPDHALELIAARMPVVRLSGWPSRSENGISNYFFILEQTDPMKDEPTLVGVARQDLVRLYAETLILPEALVQQWEINHLRNKFGQDESVWQTEGEWLRGRSPVEKQRAQLQQEMDSSTARWKAHSIVTLTLSSWNFDDSQSGNLALLNPAQKMEQAERLRMEDAKAALATFEAGHPLDQREAARTTPQQELDFARTHNAREVVSLQWLNVITVDLGGDGIAIKDLPGNVGTDLDSLRQQHVTRFDVDGDGFLEATQWIAPSEAILGIDRSGNGFIDNGSELFNGADTPFDQHGLAGLAYYDANNDGRITSDDPVYQQLRLWVDLDSDGSAGGLEVFDMRMRANLSHASGVLNDALAGMVINAIDLHTMTMQFADGSSAPLTNTALMSHTSGLQIVMDEASANLNVLHEDGLRENFITLVQDMSVLLELQSAGLSNTRRTELETLARSYGLNPASQDFMSMVQSLRATGENLGQHDTVIYFGDDDIWTDPDVRERLEQKRISFRKLGDSANANISRDSQLGRFGAALGTQAILTTSPFNDRWVPSRTLSASDVLSDAQPVANSNDTQPEQWILPTDIYSLLQVAKGAQLGGLVTQHSVAASDSEHPDQAPQTVQVFSTAQPLGKLAAAELVANEDSVVTFSYAQLEQQARTHLAETDPEANVQLLGIRSARHGVVLMDDANGQISFQPQQDFVGVAGFTYVLMDQEGRVLERDVSITLRAVNDAPHIVGESIRSKEDIPLLIDAAMLLANDADPEGDALIITGIGRTGFGRAELLGNGQIHYTPPSDQYGLTDTVEYIAQDSHGASATGTIRITLDAVDDAPSVVSERIINAREDQTLRIASRLLLWNDFDIDTDARTGASALTITAVGSAEHGKVTLDHSGEIVFTPDANYNGAASFRYTVKDETGLFTTGRSQLRIDPVNDAPLAAGEQIASKEDERLAIDPSLLLINEIDTDIARGEKQKLTVITVDMAIGGQVQMKEGLIVFVPDSNRNGQASFRYTVSDGAGEFAQAQADITLAAVNDAPVVPAKSFTAVEDSTLVISIERLLEGVTDVDGDCLVFQVQTIANPVGGSVEQVNGQVLFRPTANYYGAAGFEYTVSDQQGAWTTAMVAININNVNDAPSFINGSKFEPVGEEDQEIRISESALTKMFWDADGDLVQLNPATVRALNTGDSLRFDQARRELVFRGAANANGNRKIAFSMTDGEALSATQTLDINLRPVNDAPVVNAIGFKMLEDGGETNPYWSAWTYLSYDFLLSGATDPDGDHLKISSTPVGHRTGYGDNTPIDIRNDSANSRISLAGGLNYNGTVEFKFTVEDDKGLQTKQKAYGVVVPVNDAPYMSLQKTNTVTYSSFYLPSKRIIDTWEISAWDPDIKDSVNLAMERNPLIGSATLGAAVTTPDNAGGVRTQANIITNSGIGNTATSESVWISATDAAGAKSLISLSFTANHNVDPIVIDLDQDGLSFIDIANSSVSFNTNGDGVFRRSAWIGAKDAILAWDHDQNGVINRLDEIAFASHLNPDSAGLSDLQALQQPEFDQNQDGIFNALDAKWQHFRLWQDLNSNGISEDGELQTLEQAGIKNLYLAANVLNRAEGPDVRVRGYTRVEMTDGRLLQAADVWFNQESDRTAGNAAPDSTAQQVTQLGTDQLRSLLEQLAKTPTGSNHAPLLYGYLTTQYAEEGKQFRVDIAPNMFIDPDVGDNLSFTARKADGFSLPDWLHFDAQRLRFEGQPTADDAGSWQIILEATDNTQTSTATSFNLIATQLNHAPQLNHTLDLMAWSPGVDNQTKLPKDLFKDPNKGDSLTVVARLADQSALPDWLAFDPIALTLRGNPSLEQLATPLILAFTATDLGGLMSTTTTSLTASRAGTADSDVLTGIGSDTFVGGAGDDLLDGGTGNDNYVFGTGWGNDIIREKAGSAEEVNVISFVNGVSFDQLEFSRDLEAIYIRSKKALTNLTEPINQVKIENFYRQDGWSPIQEMRFADGKVVNDLTALDPAFNGTLTSGADVFSGSKFGNNAINGGAGDDTLYGGAGKDSLNGGTGNDRLYGGANNDLYHFARGDGVDLLIDTDGFDTLQFNGVSDIAELDFQKKGTDLWAAFKNSADSITIHDFYVAEGQINTVGGIDSFKLGYYGATLPASAANALVVESIWKSSAGTAQVD